MQLLFSLLWLYFYLDKGGHITPKFMVKKSFSPDFFLEHHHQQTYCIGGGLEMIRSEEVKYLGFVHFRIEYKGSFKKLPHRTLNLRDSNSNNILFLIYISAGDFTSIQCYFRYYVFFFCQV